HRVSVGGYLGREQGQGLLAAGLAEQTLGEAGSLALLHRRAALQVGQRERAPAVAAIGGAEEREQRRVLRDRHQLSGAQGPTLGREREGEDAYLGDEGIRHVMRPTVCDGKNGTARSLGVSGLRREDAEQRDDEVDAQ